jgi:predicted transcriptional regulator
LTAIPEVTDNTAWAALTTGALCAYNNNWDNVSSIISVADLIGAGPQPLKFEFCNESDDPFDPIKSSRAIISVWAYSMFAFDDLYSQSEMANYVEIKQSANLWWKGYVDPHQCQEQYGPVPYQADIYCIDGLTLLQKIPYEESEGIPYNGRKLESQIILDILSKIGLTEFKEYVNVYEVDMNAGIDDSPMDQLLIDVDVFEDMYCDEVLKEILTKYKACIRQIDGIFCIYRPRELTNITVYGRHFTSAITKTAVTLTPKQYIKRPDYSSSLLEVKSGSKMLQDPAKKVIITQDYGNKDSWLDNYQFKSNTYSGFPWKFDYWELEESAYVIPVSNYIPGETEGCMFANQNPWGEHVKCIYQKFGTNAVVTTDDFGFSFEYMYYNTGITPVEQVYFTIEIKNTIGTRWLRAKLMGTTWVDDMTWETEQHYIIAVQDSPPGKTDWFTFERKIPGLPVNGDFKISIFAPEPHSPMILTAIKNIKFYTTGLEISQKAEMRIVPYQRKRFLGIFYSKMREKEIYYFPFEPVTIIEREYTSENPGNKGLDLEYKSLLGDVTDTNVDNVLEQFAGALAKATPQVRVDKITLTGNSGQCLLTCDGIGRYAVWDNSLTHTAEEFVTAYEGLWLTDGITLTSSGEDVIFTSVTAGDEFFGETKVSYQSGTLDGIVEYNTPAFGLTPTLAWNTREGRENKPLLQIMADEMASQFSRYKQFLDLPLLETIKIESVLNLLGNFQDAINLRNGYLRVFIANRGTFDVKLRKWQLDLIEMGEAEAIAEGESLTADTVLITADTVEITADQTHK